MKIPENPIFKKLTIFFRESYSAAYLNYNKHYNLTEKCNNSECDYFCHESQPEMMPKRNVKCKQKLRKLHLSPKALSSSCFLSQNRKITKHGSMTSC